MIECYGLEAARECYFKCLTLFVGTVRRILGLIHFAIIFKFLLCIEENILAQKVYIRIIVIIKVIF